MSTVDLESVLDCLTEGVLCLDLESRVRYMNRAAREMLGYGGREVEGEPCRKLVQSELCGSQHCALENILRTGRSLHRVETVIQARDGRRIPVSITAAQLLDRSGRRVGVVEVFRELRQEQALGQRPAPGEALEGMVGKSQRMQELFQVLPSIGASEATVLIQGEAGTGKETLARAIHRLSPRRDGPFVKVNCGALGEEILESELFGRARERGGGAADRPGCVELADGGTLFLDDVGALSLATQVKLLRVLQDGVVQRPGGAGSVRVNVRVVAATPRELARAVEQGAFRRDLYYRLRVVPLHLPPLRERREDIPLLVAHFLERLTRRTGKAVAGLSTEAMALLLSYPYPGNLRELENILEHAFVLCPGGTIQAEHLPQEVRSQQGDPIGKAMDREDPMDALERELLLRVLEQTGWAMGKAAKLLKISRTTLWRKLKAHGIRKPS